VLGGITIYLVLSSLYESFVLHTVFTLEILTGVATVIGVVALYTRWVTSDRIPTEPKTLVGKYVYAAKRGVCPLVDFTGETTKASDKLN